MESSHAGDSRKSGWSGTEAVAERLEEDYRHAFHGLRALRGQTPIKPENPYQLRDVGTLLLGALRPEECFRLRWADVRSGALHVLFRKTDNARRRIPLTPRALALLEIRRPAVAEEWIFPAPTKSGHIEKSTLKKQHKKACAIAKLDRFTLYTFRHTCLTRWAEVMDPYTLAYLAGHADSSTTKRYVHPQTETILKRLPGQVDPKPPPSPHPSPNQENRRAAFACRLHVPSMPQCATRNRA